MFLPKYLPQFYLIFYKNPLFFTYQILPLLTFSILTINFWQPMILVLPFPYITLQS